MVDREERRRYNGAEPYNNPQLNFVLSQQRMSGGMPGNGNKMKIQKEVRVDDEIRKEIPKKSTVVYGSVDKGWAWVVMIVLALWNTLMAGTLKSFGILYLEFLELYDRGPVATAWLGFSFSFLTTVIAPVSGYIGDHVSLGAQRKLVMVVGVVMALTISATGWMPTLEGAVLTYGLAGFGAAIIDTPILGLLGKYFRERRFLASGVVFAGSSFGTLVLPPLLTGLVDAYAVRGAMVVFGAIWLHTLVIGAVIRPIRAPTETYSEAADGGDHTDTPGDDEEEHLGTLYEDDTANCLCSEKQIDREMKRSTLSLEVQPYGISMFTGSSRQSLDRQVAMKRLHRIHNHSKSVPALSRVLHDDSKYVCLSVNNINMDNDTSALEKPTGNNNNSHSNARIGENNVPSNDSNLCENCDAKPLSFSKKLCRAVQDYWLFLQTPGLPMLIVTFCAASFAYFNQFFLFPPLAQELGMTKMQGALLVSVCNGTELVARLVVGVLVDKGKLQKPTLVKVSFVLSAIAGFTVSFFDSQMLLYVYSGIFGLVGGVFVPLSIPLMIELVPESQVASAAGIFVLVTGTGISLGPPILGAVKALTGTFADSLRLCSVCYLVALVLYIIHCGDVTRCIKNRRKQRHLAILEQEIP